MKLCTRLKSVFSCWNSPPGKALLGVSRCRRYVFFSLFLACTAQPATLLGQSVTYVPTISNITANGAGFSGDTGLASAAHVDHPSDVAFDASGNVYIADATNNAIRRIDAVTGIITTVAGVGGTAAGYTGDTGPATSATLSNPTGVAVDSNGNIYIADTGNNAVRVVYKAGSIPNIASPVAGDIYTIAGSTAGTSGSTGNGSAANTALLNFPTALAIDSANNIYIADAHNSMVRKITLSTGIIARYAGTGLGGDGGSGGAAAQTAMNNCYGIALDASGNLYISDTKNYILRVVNASTQIMTTVAGIAGSEGTVGQTNGNGGPALSAKLDYVQRLTVDKHGNVLLADTNAEQIRLYNPTTLTLTAVAGTGTAGLTLGSAVGSELNGPLGLAVDTNNNIYIADTANHVVQRVNASATAPYAALNVGAAGVAQSFYAQLGSAVTVSSYQTAAGFPDFTMGTVTGCTLAASNTAGSICAAPVTFAPLAPGLRTAPLTLTSGSAQYTLGLYGTGNAPAIALTPGTTSTIAGTATAGYTGDTGTATAAEVNRPSAAIVDGAGAIYIADTANNVVRKIQGGVITTIAGNNTPGFSGDGSAATSAELSGPTALALDSSNNLYIADTGNNRIREVIAGVINTVAGSATSGYAGDGAAATSAELNAPAGVAVDLSGNIYIGDTGNNRIRLVTASTGFISTIAGTGTAGFSGDTAAATSAKLDGPTRLALDFSGGLYVADTLNSAVRKIALTAGTINTVAGTGGSANFSGDGGLATSATLSAPTGIALDAAGNLYIADTANNRIRQVLSSGGTISTIAGNASGSFAGDGGSALAASFNAPASVALDAAGKLYIADTMNSRIRLVDTTAASLAFGTVNPGSSSLPLTAVATNIGNQTLNFSSFSVAASFTQQTSGSTDCSATTVLAAGQSCNVKLIFQPSTTGSYNGSIAFTDNALNQSAAAQSVALTGTSTLTPTGLTVSGLPTSVTAGVAQSITVVAVKNTTTVTTYTGTIHFTSSDPAAILPADYTYTAGDSGSHIFSVTFKTAGAQSVSIADTQNINITGAEGSTVKSAAAASLNILSGNNQTIQLGGAFPIGFAVQALDAYGNSVSGVSILFTAPSSGAGGTFPGNAATATIATDVNGDAVAPTFTANTTAGSYSVVASAASLTPVSFSLTNSGNVVPVITLALSPVSSTLLYGQSTSITASLTPSVVNSVSATGSVTFYDNCSTQGALFIGTGTVRTGSATFTDSIPSTGSHSFTATYSGDSNFATSTTQTAIPLTINAASVTLTGPATTTTVVAGQTGTMAITITGQYPGTNVVPPTGSLSYQIGSGTASSAPIELGTATLSIPTTLAAGNYFVTVSYTGDDNYQTASISVPLTISFQSQTITLAANPSHTYGDSPITLSANASSGLPVSFKIISGPGAITGSVLTILGAGSITFEADQSGNTFYSAATGVQQTISVTKASTQTALVSSASSINQGAGITFTATVTNSINGAVATGAVNFYSGGTTLLGQGTLNSAGVATYTNTTLAAGTYTITAQYASDSNFNSSTSNGVGLTVTAPIFTYTLPTTITTAHGENVLTAFTLNPVGNYSGTITFSCSNLPADASCVFQPNPVTLTPAASVTVYLTIKTSVAVSANAAPHTFTWLALSPGLLCLLGCVRRRRLLAKASGLLAVSLLAAGLLALSGCGTQSTSTASAFTDTPPGTTTITITATDGTVTQSGTYTLVVE